MTTKDQIAIARLYTENYDEVAGIEYPDPNKDYKNFGNIFATLYENLKIVQDNLSRIDPNKSGLNIEKIDNLISELLPEVSLVGKPSVNSYTTFDNEKMQ